VASRIVHLFQIQLDSLGKVRQGFVNRVTLVLRPMQSSPRAETSRPPRVRVFIVRIS
jgi:hypothetical protein